MSDISDISSESAASASSWNRAFESTFDDYLPINSPIPQNTRYVSQSSNQFPPIQHGYQNFMTEPLFVNEISYEWRNENTHQIPSQPVVGMQNTPINQYIGPSIHNLGAYHEPSSPQPKRLRQNISSALNESSSQLVGQSNNHSYNQHITQSNNQSSTSSATPLSEVLSAAQSITIPTLTSMNIASTSSSSKRKRRTSPERASNEPTQPNASMNRAEVKKQKHREIDAVRRQREATVIARLQELNTQYTELFEQGESSIGESSSKRSTSPPAPRSNGVSGHSKDKVSVLEEAADKTAALQELCRKLTETCAKQQQSIAHLTDHVTTLAQKLQVQADDALTFNQNTATTAAAPVQPAISSESSFFAGISLSEPITQHFSALPPRVQEYLGQMDRSFALYSSCFLQATVCIMIISVKTGRLIDANSCFFRTSGWSADQIIGRVLTAPIEFVLGKRPTSSMTEVERLLDEQTRPLVRRNGQLVPARRVPQYPRSKQKFKDLVMGVADQIEAIWRSELADGNMYEVKNICYSGKRETVEDERGRVSLRPVHVVFACSALDGIKLT